MSDRERSRSRTRNGSREPPPKAPVMSRGHSRSRSRTPPPPKSSARKYRSPTRSRSGSPRRGYRSRYSRSRSRSYSPRGSYRRSHSHSPMSSRRRHQGDRVSFVKNQQSQENPTPSRCLGVFGLSLYTTEQQINHIFSKFGPVEKVQVVIDAKTGRSRGFCFVYYESMDDAKVAKNECTGMEIDGRRIRVDFSITQRAHTPTPGIYMGKPTASGRGDNGYDRRRDRDDYYYRGGGGGGGGGGYRERDYYHRGYRHRSPSPHYRRSRRYERERSYSPRKSYYER